MRGCACTQSVEARVHAWQVVAAAGEGKTAGWDYRGWVAARPPPPLLAGLGV